VSSSNKHSSLPKLSFSSILKLSDSLFDSFVFRLDLFTFETFELDLLDLLDLFLDSSCLLDKIEDLLEILLY